ncbi:HD domain-containing protein [Desulfocastanea catecholica]
MLLQLTKKERQVLGLAVPHLQVMSNELHTKEVVRFCLQLLQTVGGERHIVIPAAILHDTGWAKIPENISQKIRGPDNDHGSVKIHEEISALIAELILRDVDYKKVYIDEIVAMIIGHDSRKVALSLNDKILKDGDKLSRFSKEFSKIWPNWRDGSAAKDVYGILSNGVKNWFFLSDSRRIASIELDQRIQEDHMRKANYSAS